LLPLSAIVAKGQAIAAPSWPLVAAVLFALDVNVLQVLFIFALLNIPVIATLTYSAYKKRAQ
jgi:hypothetical protein